MPDTLKKLREPAAYAAVAFAGLVLLTAVINLLAPSSAGSAPFASRAYDEVTTFLDVVVSGAAAGAVYLANHVAPALAKARLITLAALVEEGVAVLFGVITAFALFGADGVSGEDKFLKFLQAAGGAGVVAVAAMFVWLTWQPYAAQKPGPVPGRAAGVGPDWPGGGQPYGQQQPPPGGFGWSPQQQGGAMGGQPGYGAQPGQVSGFPQQSGAVGGYGAQQPGGDPAFPQQAAGTPQQYGTDRTQYLPSVQAGQQHQGVQPPVPPIQDYAAQPSPWSPGGPGQPAPRQPEQRDVPGRADEAEQRSGPFQIGDWHSE
jgi:hypothetical protein